MKCSISVYTEAKNAQNNFIEQDILNTFKNDTEFALLTESI